MIDLQSWENRCADVLRANQITSKGYRYTRPAPRTYEQQWLWDSCFHALVYQHIDEAMAWDELRSICAGQITTGPDAGMIPHMIYWQGGGAALWGTDDQSIITQPPLIASAAFRIAQTTGQKDPLRELYSSLCAYHEWFDRRRDPDQDHLVTLIHPWESGWDASPRWDLPMNLNRPSDEVSKIARHSLVHVLQEADTDVSVLERAGSFCVETADFNAIRAADLEALADIGEVIGANDSEKWRTKAYEVQQAVREKLIQKDETGRLIACDLSGTDEVPIHSSSAAQFVLFFGGCVSSAEAEELVARLQSAAFWPRYPVPSTATDHPDFGPAHYWRGNVWMSVNWLIHAGLRRYGYHDLARDLAQRSAALVGSSGFHEYFNPLSGDGYGPNQQSWTTLVLDMLVTSNL